MIRLGYKAVLNCKHKREREERPVINGKTLRNTLLVIAALALAVFLIVSFGLFSASGHQSPGRIEDGVYYYSRFNCGLAYTPGEGSKLLSLPWKFG